MKQRAAAPTREWPETLLGVLLVMVFGMCLDKFLR